ncbi:MAG: HYC_CC_PP family protein [Salibacteraceae bacterium]
MKRTFAIFLATLILFSNSGVVFATHYCMGEIANISIGLSTEAHKCEMAKMDDPCTFSTSLDGNNLKPIDCCSNDFVQIQLDENFDSPVQVDSELNTKFVAAFTLVYLNLYNFQSESNADFIDYSPPLLSQNIPVLFQSFLI